MRVERDDDAVPELVWVEGLHFALGPHQGPLIKDAYTIILRVKADRRKADSQLGIDLHPKDGDMQVGRLHLCLYLTEIEVDFLDEFLFLL